MSSDRDLWGDDDPSFLEALTSVVIPNHTPRSTTTNTFLAGRVATSKPQPDATQIGTHPSPLGKKRQRETSPGPSHKTTPNPNGSSGNPPKTIIYNLKPAKDDKNSRADTSDPSYVYGAAHFGDYGEYMHRKRAKLQIQNRQLAGATEEEVQKSSHGFFKGVAIYVSYSSLKSIWYYG